ncbi:MAG: hypothetical protein WC807_00880 [Hyphomicrobium sp.]|jgi:hypothetical protein
MLVSKSARFATAILIAISAMLVGCAVSQGTDIEQRSGLACVDDSIECISRRQSTLRHMVDDPGRAWVKEPPTPEAYASGVRLFAYKTKKKELSCAELAHGKQEADAARTSLKSAGAKLTHTQVARGAMLATEVGRELQNEINRRCQKG